MAKRALRLASRDLSVLPMHSAHRGRCTCSQGNACERAGKHPITQHGVNDATTKRDQIDSWWTASPDANIGIATGTASGIIVLDIDPRNGGTRTLQRLEKELGPLPKTVTSITGGGGEHRIFAYPTFPVRKDNSGKLLGSGVDVLSDGCIIHRQIAVNIAKLPEFPWRRTLTPEGRRYEPGYGLVEQFCTDPIWASVTLFSGLKGFKQGATDV